MCKCKCVLVYPAVVESAWRFYLRPGLAQQRFGVFGFVSLSNKNLCSLSFVLVFVLSVSWLTMNSPVGFRHYALQNSRVGALCQLGGSGKEFKSNFSVQNFTNFSLIITTF